MAWPESSLRAQVAAAAVFVVFAVGLIFVSRQFHASADEAFSGEEAAARATPPSTRPAGVPLTPRTATNARELHQALETAFGKNARGVSFITYVDYDPHPDRLHITFALDDADPKRPGSERAALTRMGQILGAIHDGQMKWTWVLLTGTAQARDYKGAVDESTVIRAQFSRDRLRRPDWAKIRFEKLPKSAEQYWTYADLAR